MNQWGNESELFSSQYAPLSVHQTEIFLKGSSMLIVKQHRNPNKKLIWIFIQCYKLSKMAFTYDSWTMKNPEVTVIQQRELYLCILF